MTLFFSDTTVLINTEMLQRWDIVQALIGSKARWAASVEAECRDWISTYPSIHNNAALVFGDSVAPEGADHVDIRTLRNLMAAPYDPPRKHLGEAETIVIIERRFAGSVVISDDGGAQRVATARGITTIGTGDLLRLAVKRGLMTDVEESAALSHLRANQRYPRTFH